MYYLKTGQDNIIYKKRFFFIKTKTNFLQKIEGMLAMNLHYPQELPFSFLAKTIKHDNGFLIINKNGLVEGMNKELLATFGFVDVEALPIYYKFDIEYIITDFNFLI